MLLALVVLGCGGKAGRSTSSTQSTTSTATTSTTPGLATPATNVCVAKAARVIAAYTHRPVAKVKMTRGHDNSGASDCHFRSGALVAIASVSGAPDAYAVLERKAEEEAQIFGAQRLVPAPQYIQHLGIDAYWYPRERFVQTTDAVNLITAGVIHWPTASRHRWEHMSEALAKRYLGKLRPKLARGPAP